jgi:hypothetical protein
MAEHTLLPWAISNHAGVISRGWIKSVCKGFPERIVAQVMGQETTAEREANTAYIVRACNAYPDMVKALEQIEYASRKDSLTDAERLESIRVILGRVGGARE